MHQCIKSFYFGVTLHVSDGLSILFHLISASKQTAVSVWHMHVAVCTVLNSWWWTERPSETCRASFQNKIIWYIGAYSWFYSRNIMMHGPMNVKWDIHILILIDHITCSRYTRKLNGLTSTVVLLICSRTKAGQQIITGCGASVVRCPLLSNLF